MDILLYFIKTHAVELQRNRITLAILAKVERPRCVDRELDKERSGGLS